MKELPTIKEFFKEDMSKSTDEWIEGYIFCEPEKIIEFTKLHVEAQREAIKKNIKQKIVNPPLTRDEQYTIIDKQSIDDAYPLNNIK